MPEVILPCPECGDDECLIVIQELPSEEWSVHCGCGHAGRYCASKEDAIKAHNDLPRALTWTHEPPKVAGWYWRKETAADRAHVFHFTGNWEDYGEHWESDRVCQLPLNLNGNLWAGPIAPPIG